MDFPIAALKTMHDAAGRHTLAASTSGSNAGSSCAVDAVSFVSEPLDTMAPEHPPFSHFRSDGTVVDTMGNGFMDLKAFHTWHGSGASSSWASSGWSGGAWGGRTSRRRR